MNNLAEFSAEIKEVKSKKLVSNDIEYSIRLTTNNPNILSLAVVPADSLIKVIIQKE